DDRDEVALAADRARDVEPVVVAGEHDVEDDEVHRPAPHLVERLRGRPREPDLVARVLEVVAEAEGEVLLVLDEEDPAHVGLPAPSSRTSIATAWRPAGTIASSIRTPVGRPCFRALSTRLSRTWRKSARSISTVALGPVPSSSRAIGCPSPAGAMPLSTAARR